MISPTSCRITGSEQLSEGQLLDITARPSLHLLFGCVLKN